MKSSRERYQHGSVRKVPRSQGFAWEFRYYSTDSTGKRKLKVQTFDPAKYPTERDVRKAIEPQLAALNAGTLAGKVAATLGTIIQKYYEDKDQFPALRHSTQTTNKSLIELHIRPKFGQTRLADVTALSVNEWLKTLPVGATSKARARNIISKLLDLAMLWEFLPLGRNPMELVKVKGSTKRQKSLTVISPAEFKALVESLPEPYNLMVLVCGCLGLRVSETLGLKWGDFNFADNTVTIKQVFTHGKVQELPKTATSGDPLPVPPKLMEILKDWQQKQEHDYSWVFPGKRGSPYSDSTILTDYLKPAARKLGIEGLGWHTFRHSYRTWMASQNIDTATMKDLMRHADISTTMNVYGKTLSPELRAANMLVANQLL